MWQVCSRNCPVSAAQVTEPLLPSGPVQHTVQQSKQGTFSSTTYHNSSTRVQRRQRPAHFVSRRGTSKHKLNKHDHDHLPHGNPAYMSVHLAGSTAQLDLSLPAHPAHPPLPINAPVSVTVKRACFVHPRCSEYSHHQ